MYNNKTMNKTNKEKDLIISGKTISVNFGVNYFYRYFLEATGVDLVAQGMVDINTIKVFDYLAGFIYAGAKACCSLKDTPSDITLESARHMVYCMTEIEAADLLRECLAIMSGVTVDELKNGQAQAAKKNGNGKVKAS